MPNPRKEVVVEGVESTYHCISRCVRRAFLCGVDALTGKSFDHRKEWIEERLRFLAETFAADVCSYAIMANHAHFVIRVRPGQIQDWSDEEVARRWLSLYPGRRTHTMTEPETEQVTKLASQRERLLEIRKRLGSISWFMRCLNEYIARRANEEENCTGHFWESRFKCQVLLDNAAILACMAYVDLNPIRAKVAKTPETSPFTSVYHRTRAKAAKTKRTATAIHNPTQKQQALLNEARLAGTAAEWLCPIYKRRPVKSVKQETYYQQNPSALPIALGEYLSLLDWTGRSIRAGKKGAIPSHLKPILHRLEIDAEQWVQTVERYGSTFWRMVGTAEKLVAAATAVGKQWLCGVRASAKVFASPAMT